MQHILSANQRRTLFIVYYVSFAALIALKFGLGACITNYRIMTAGVAARAAITSTNCSDHKTFSYRFTVGDTTYGGSGEEGFGIPSCAALKQGEQIPVSYLKNDPRTNVPGDPKSRFIDRITLVAMSALFIPIIVLFTIFGIARLVLKRPV